MSSEENLTHRILAAMKGKPYEKNARGIAQLINDSKLYFQIKDRLNFMVEAAMVKHTRKIGKTDNYCLPEYYDEVMGN